jgi:hypothetical protein
MEDLLTQQNKSTMCTVLALGGDRATACKLMGVSLQQLLAEMERDPEFAKAVLNAEGKAELEHMRNVRMAAIDDKNWRGSIWWLERRDRSQDDVDEESPWSNLSFVREALAKLVEVVVAEIGDPIRRQLLVARLLEVATKAGDRGAAGLTAEHVVPALMPPSNVEEGL